VLTDRALRERLAAEGRGFVAERWSSLEMARRMLALYRSLGARRAVSVMPDAA
jgi:hypothetical protein